MKAVPFGAWDVADDGVVGPFFGDSLAKCDGHEEASCSAFSVDGRVDCAGFNPGVSVGGDVFFAPSSDCVAEATVAFFVVWRWPASVPCMN